MANTNNNSLSALDMAQSYAEENDMEVEDLFKHNNEADNKEDVNEPAPAVNESPKASENIQEGWRPDPELIEGFGDVSGTPVVYNKEDIHFEGENDVKGNIEDDVASEAAREQMDNMSRAALNIQDAKKRAGIELQIPDRHPLVAQIMDCAEDTNTSRAAKNLDELMEKIKVEYPNFVIHPIDESNAETKNDVSNKISSFDNTSSAPELDPDYKDPSDNVTRSRVEENKSIEESEEVKEEPTAEIVNITVDKDAVDKVVINSEDYQKIKKKREVQLNIIEQANLEFSEIEEVFDNEVDKVLSEYTRKTNDIEGALPASKYRATFTGLSYPEVIDLSYSTEINSFDGEKRKWTIAFNHIKNPSIGPWEEYRWFIDPNTRKRVKISMKDDIPEGINVEDVHTITKFDDFLMKTSFLDIEFILWKILCATTLEKEIIQIECKNSYNGKPCKTTHNWVYRPVDLLDDESLDPSIFEDMEKTMKADSVESILQNYKSSFVCSNNVVTLPSSGIKTIFGHASAYDYLYGIYSAIEEMSNSEDVTDGLSKSMKVTLTQAIKGFLIPINGKNKKITSTEGIIKILSTLDEIDFQALNKIVEMVIQPYNNIKFRIPDVICPKCGAKDNIKIRDMENLLFIITQSLGETQVTLRHN